MNLGRNIYLIPCLLVNINIAICYTLDSIFIMLAAMLTVLLNIIPACYNLKCQRNASIADFQLDKFMTFKREF